MTATIVTDDARIREDVIEEMEYDPAVTVNDIAVVVENGVVTLSGVADSLQTRSSATDAAWRIYGVRDVIDRVVVDPTLLGQPTDGEIADDVRHRLDRDFLVPKGRVTVEVADGVVTLRGTVRWHLQVEAAIEEAEGAKGARYVTNLLQVDRGSPSPRNIEDDIKKALGRNAQLNASDIAVTTDGGRVTLSGSVDSVVEKRAAEDAAWRADGTVDVVNNISIQP